MANFWDKIKEIFQPESQQTEDHTMDTSYDAEIPLDEEFVKFFSQSGGHFLYCENQQQSIEYLKQIIDLENISRFVCFDGELQKILNSINANFINYPSATADFCFLACESLSAYNGSVVLSSHKTGGRKITELPDNFVIYAKHHQIVKNLSEAMQVLNRNKVDSLPSGITSIGGVDADALNSGHKSTKNIYLLLVE